MAVNLKTKCEQCIHNNVCGNRNAAKHFADKLRSINYGDGPNDDYDYNIMSDHYHVDIDISCKDFRKSEPVPRPQFNQYHNRGFTNTKGVK